MRFKIISLILCFFAISCATRTTPAPVENATKAPSYLDMTKPAAAPKPVDKSNNVEQAASKLNVNIEMVKEHSNLCGIEETHCSDNVYIIDPIK